ncbi:MAG: hypothetical protein ABEJ68_05260 [Halobacteriaceae archaeon]
MAWTTKHRDQEFGPFVVDDGTGSAYVDPADADLVLTSGDEYTVDGGEDPPAFVAEFLERETDVDPVGRYERRYEEYRLDLGEQARVAGETDPDATDGVEAPVVTAIVDDGGAPKFLVTDDTDLDLASRMRQEALLYFLLGGVLLAFSAMFFFVG